MKRQRRGGRGRRSMMGLRLRWSRVRGWWGVRHALVVICHTSHVTRHTSHVIRHTSHVTRHTSHVTRHTLHVTRHTSKVTRHTLHVTRHTELLLWPSVCLPCPWQVTRKPSTPNNKPSTQKHYRKMIILTASSSQHNLRNRATRVFARHVSLYNYRTQASSHRCMCYRLMRV